MDEIDRDRILKGQHVALLRKRVARSVDKEWMERGMEEMTDQMRDIKSKNNQATLERIIKEAYNHFDEMEEIIAVAIRKPYRWEMHIVYHKNLHVLLDLLATYYAIFRVDQTDGKGLRRKERLDDKIFEVMRLMSDLNNWRSK